ncbi:MAG: carbohydrate ABC transporter permease [Lachnospiraceae bacterium]|nr:carbohydrate ABC transporter permease [Lachnospiraceae bacterium]
MKKEKQQFGASPKIAKVFIYLILALLAITILVPVAWVFVASIKENSEFYRNPWAIPQGFHFQNFIDAWQTASMGDYMLKSVLVTALALFLLVIIALPAAYVLARFRFKSRAVWNTLFMAGLFINVNYIVVPIFLMLNNGDMFLRKATGHTFFLNNLFILALVYAATALPFTIYLLSGYFKSLAKDYEEAAYVDGAGYFYTMVRVIIPMAKPSVVTVILFNFLAFWNEYIISMTLLTKPELKTLPVGLMNLMAAQKSAVQYGQLYAGLVIVMLPTLILYMCVQKKLTQGMTLGGLKG